MSIACAIDVHGRALKFTLRRTQRLTLAISVEPDGQVVVTAPQTATHERIEQAVMRRAQWIKRQQKHFELLPPPLPPRQWVSGETHRYLGRQYRLRVSEGVPAVRLSGAFFEVCVPEPAASHAVEQAMQAWYRSHAKPLFRARLEAILTGTTWLGGTSQPEVVVRAMRTRWGSATPSGRIYLNIDLVKQPMGCIDYVIAHELVHLRVPHHGRTFWRLLARVCPDWERWRERLAVGAQ